MAQKLAVSTPPAVRGEMRESIKHVATELLIKHGVHNTSFRDIATRLGITTTNIHYHFGNKDGLVDEVLFDYVAETSARHRQIWCHDALTLEQKLKRLLAYNHQRYKQFNRGKAGTKPWSLIGRLRLDGDVLSDAALESLRSFTVAISTFVAQAVATAVHRRELRADTPQADLSLLLVNLVNSSSVFTQDAGGFGRLEAFFDAFTRVILSAYAPAPGSQDASP